MSSHYVVRQSADRSRDDTAAVVEDGSSDRELLLLAARKGRRPRRVSDAPGSPAARPHSRRRDGRAFSPELVDTSIYVIDAAGGDKIPRKGGPGIRRSGLLLISKIDLAPYVGASLDEMDRNTRRMRDGERAPCGIGALPSPRALSPGDLFEARQISLLGNSAQHPVLTSKGSAWAISHRAPSPL